MWNMSLLMGNAQPFILQIITIKQTPRGQPPSAYLFRKVNQRPGGASHLPPRL